MKVVHVVSKDNGGAARAAIRINCALQGQGVDSKLLVLHKTLNEDYIRSIFSSKLAWNVFRVIRKVNDKIVRKYDLTGKFYRGKVGVDISKNRWVREADVIHLHWINDGMMTIKDIERLALSGKKIVWTMHDMFSFTAGCYYDGECGGYETGCQICPYAEGNKEAEFFIKKQFTEKLTAYSKANISFVGCSKWMAKSAKKSPLTKGHEVVAIANPIDTEVFKFVDINAAKLSFDINTGKKIVLFGAISADSDPRKGFKFLQQAIELLDSQKYLLVVFGNNNVDIQIDDRFEAVGVGKINTDSKLVELYSMADVFVAPSTQENLSNAVMEALACGTPVVAFDVGGMKDMIDHKHTGYLAKAFSVEDLSKGIAWASENKGTLIKQCREKVEAEFSYSKIGWAYNQLYINNSEEQSKSI